MRGCSRQNGVLLPRTTNTTASGACTLDLLQQLGSAAGLFSRWSCEEAASTRWCWVSVHNNDIYPFVRDRAVYPAVLQYICEGKVIIL